MAHVTIEEREAIQKGLWEKKSVRQIARELGRPHSTISKEIRRNLPPERRVYTPRLANERALQKRSSRGREARLKSPTLRAYVVEHLKLGWSPEQIAHTAPAPLSHEAIYQYIYAQIHRKGMGT
jgi:IS30 family transposase